MRGRFSDGVWLVELASVADPTLVLPAIADVLQVRENPGQHWRLTMAKAVGDRNALLLVDNFEHLLPAAVDLAALLQTCESLTALVTSRAVLRVRGEEVVVLGPSGALNSTGLQSTLHNLGVDALVVTGLTTDVCVSTTAREAADRGFAVTVVDDACTTLSDVMHRAELEAFGLAFGRVRSTGEVLQLLRPAATTEPAATSAG